MAKLPTNADVAAQFELLSDIFELENVESFRVLAYRRAATRIRETGTSVAQMALDGKAKELQGVGKTIEEKIVQIVLPTPWSSFAFPSSAIWATEVPVSRIRVAARR